MKYLNACVIHIKLTAVCNTVIYHSRTMICTMFLCSDEYSFLLQVADSATLKSVASFKTFKELIEPSVYSLKTCNVFVHCAPQVCF